jgi:hypothetical protein
MIFLTGVSSCRSVPKDFPAIPEFTIKQTVIGEGQSCREWAIKDGKWVKIAQHDLSACHGILGVNAREYAEFQDFIRKAQQWAKEHAEKN